MKRQPVLNCLLAAIACILMPIFAHAASESARRCIDLWQTDSPLRNLRTRTGFQRTALDGSQVYLGMLMHQRDPSKRVSIEPGWVAAHGFSTRLVGEIKGPRGGLRKVLWHPRAHKWFSLQQDMNERGTVRGNILWPLNFLGDEAAPFFGFDRPKEHIVLAPDAKEASLTIAAYNEGLPIENQIRVSFYEPETEFVPSAEYDRKFVLERQLPIARTGTEAMHDLTFHYLAILFMPNRYLDLHIRQMKSLLQLRDFILSRHPDQAPLTAKLEGLVSAQIDGFTSGPLAAFPQFIAERPSQFFGRNFRLGADDMTWLYHGKSPSEVLRSVKLDIPESELNEFISLMNQSEPDFNVGIRNLTAEKITVDVNARILQVRQRAAELYRSSLRHAP